jgi:hypothetical protein
MGGHDERAADVAHEAYRPIMRRGRRHGNIAQPRAAVLPAGQAFPASHDPGKNSKGADPPGCQERSITVISGGIPKRTGRIEQPIPPVTTM